MLQPGSGAGRRGGGLSGEERVKSPVSETDRQTDRKCMVTGVIGPAPGIRMSRKKGLPSALGSGAEYWR